jgi:hypothetical protein
MDILKNFIIKVNALVSIGDDTHYGTVVGVSIIDASLKTLTITYQNNHGTKQSIDFELDGWDNLFEIINS